jgi:hypothetical protein
MSYEAGKIYKVDIPEFSREGHEVHGHPERYVVLVSKMGHPKYPDVWLCVPLVKWEDAFDAFVDTLYIKHITKNKSSKETQTRTPDPFQMCALDLRKNARNGRDTEERLSKEQLAKLRECIRFAIGDCP